MYDNDVYCVQVVMGLCDSYKSLDQYTSSQLALQPVCLFGSLTYLLIHQLGRKIAWFRMTMKTFQAIFFKMLQEDEVMEKWKGEEEEGGRRLAFEAVFRRCLIRALAVELQTYVCLLCMYNEFALILVTSYK